MCKVVTTKDGQEDHLWIISDDRQWQSLRNLLYIEVGNHRRVENKVDSSVKKALTEEIWKMIDYAEHHIRGFLP